MRRREFLAITGSGLAGAVAGCAGTPFAAADLPVHLQLIAQNDRVVASLLQRQQTAADHPARGGVPNPHDIYEPGAASGVLRAGAVAYVSPTSRYHHAGELVERMALAIGFLLRVQHTDGTIDLLSTNFHSPPDTGFVLEWVTAATGLLRASGRSELTGLLADLERFVRRAAAALAVGGIHTPNHRWVVCMALARAHHLFPDPRYPARIDAWLGEGIDIDADGQFTERSTAIYSPLTDRCLLTVARLLDRPELLEPVRRNLEMTLFYLHADGEVATEASRRQDQFRPGSLASYYYPYRYLAQRDRNGRFAAAVRWIEATALERLTRDAVFFVETPALAGPLPGSAALPTDYERHFAGSDLVRIRRGALSATILADNPTFLSYHRGGAAMVVRCAAAFFGKGQFVGTNLSRNGGGWSMTQELSGPYWQPLPPERRTGRNDWARVVRETRTPSEVQTLRSAVVIHDTTDGFLVDFSITGTDRVPVAIELGCRPGGELSGAGLQATATPGAWLLAAGEGRYRYGADEIRFGPGQRGHAWTGLRGALPKLAADCVYLTGFTPLRTQLRLG